MTIALDFETHAVQSRPEYPPKPVGLAYAHEDKKGYLAWGHYSENNSSAFEAAKLLREAFRGGYGTVVFHNAIFDIDVAQIHFGLSWPTSFDDTMILAFLDDPGAVSLGLKQLAMKYLTRRAGERDRLFEWIYEHVRIKNKNGTPVRVPKSQLGAYICEAPGKLVGEYATADATMTLKLFNKLRYMVCARGMYPAYQREIYLLPTTLEMERGGMRADRDGLAVLRDGLTDLRDKYDVSIRKTLKEPGLNVDSGPQLGAALVKAGKLSRRTPTATGKQSTAKNVLIETCNDQVLTRMLSLRSVTDKYLTGFITPWLEASSKTGGYIMPRFNQIRGAGGGTRTGRYSSADPNFQQIPSNIDAEDPKTSVILRALVGELAEIGIRNFRGLRDYLLVDEGRLLVAADYSQQELRILAHFEGGPLMAQYLRDPKMDVHAWVQELVKSRTGVDYPRKYIKTVVFMLLYGGGAKKLAAMLDLPLDQAYRLRNSVLDALPGVRRLMNETKGEIVTWGGRIYGVDPPMTFGGNEDTEGDTVSFEYKQLNKLIQGSAAECTKQGMLNVREWVPTARIAVTVHDELVVMVDSHKDAINVVRAMCDVQFNVPMLAEARISSTTWARAAA